MSIERFDREISSAELTRWIAYAGIEPFGYPVDNFRIGAMASAIVNAIHATIPVPEGKPRTKPLKVTDFYPQQKKAHPELTPELEQALRKKREKRK